MWASWMTRRSLLLVHPGASSSTADVFNGLSWGLRQLDVNLHEYSLDRRLLWARRFLQSAYRRHVKVNGPLKDTPPQNEDILYLAGQGVIERALQADAEWVIVISGGNFHPACVQLLRRAGRKVGVVLTEGPYWTEWEQQYAASADVCWTNERTSVAAIRQTCPFTFYLPTAFHPEHHRPLEPRELDNDLPAHDVVFVGTGFEERIALLEQIDWTGIDLGLYGLWELLPSRHRLRTCVRGRTIDNRDAVILYQKAKIGLNLYRTSKGYGRGMPHVEGAESLNPRAYELAACGVFQVSDYRAEVSEVFGGHAVPFFQWSGGLEGKIRYFLEQLGIRMQFATEARQRVQPHNYGARAVQLLRDLDTYERQRERATAVQYESSALTTAVGPIALER